MKFFLICGIAALVILTVSITQAQRPNVNSPNQRAVTPPADVEPNFRLNQNQILPRPTAPITNQTQNVGDDRLDQSDDDLFDATDPTQSAPDIRRILEGEPPQQQARLDPPQPPEVVGKVIGQNGEARALLRISERYYMVEVGTRLSLPTNLEPIIYTVTTIDLDGIEITNSDGKETQRLP